MKEEKYDSIIIGFGKGGKTLAGELANHGEKVAVIEKSNQMYGGTCINVGCIPTKYLITKSGNTKLKNFEKFDDFKEFYKQTINNKKEFISKLRTKNFNMLNDRDEITIYTGMSSFLSKDQIRVKMEQEEYILSADKFFINTGSQTIIPNIPGLDKVEKVYTSTSIMELEELPEKLVIIGGGYIGLEYSFMFQNFGSQVTVLEASEQLIGREDTEISEAVKESLEKRGIQFEMGYQVAEIQQQNEKIVVKGNNGKEIVADAVLLATGRKANTEGLNLENAGIKTNERGEIIVDKYLQTNIPNIWAIGDVKGGLQFTYISLDDYRIIRSQLYGNKEYTLEERRNVPYSVFIEPHLSRVGLNEKEAIQQGYHIKIGVMLAKESPRANILGLTDGILKAIVDADTDKILGVTLFCAMSAEMINIVRVAMMAGVDYKIVRDNIYTHPTMSESLNDLFSRVK